MIDVIFRWCATFLVTLAGLLGISYEAVNVWIFVILWPLLTVGLLILLAVQHRQIQKLKESLR